MSKKIVIALGGNALGQTVEEQKLMVAKTAENIIPIIKAGYEIIITHGNGPQVGLINLAFSESSKTNSKVQEMPFPECGAMSEGYIGYHLQNALKNELLKNNINKSVVTMITQVEVSKDDKAFSNPTKPIGSFYTLEESKTKPYPMKEDAGRGYRRVIASPLPIDIVEKNAINDLINNHHLVICVGGGGIPVINDNGIITGVDAVIDKDFASSLLADKLDADYFLILTAVDKVSLNFNKQNQINLDTLTVNEAKKYISEGHFYSGSMLPKVEAAVRFVEKKDNRISIITSIGNCYNAIVNKNIGTKIVK